MAKSSLHVRRRLLVASSLAIGVASCATLDREFVADFREPVDLAFVGAASTQGERLRISPPERFIQGAVWHTRRWDLRRGFEVEFQFRIGEFGDWPPGYYHDVSSDGIAFVIQDASTMALGGGGGGMSYDDLPRSLAVEFDMWPNQDEGDPNGNHISVQTRCAEPNSHWHEHSLGCTTDIPNLSDEEVHHVRIVCAPGALSVFLDRGPEPVLTVPVDLPACIGSQDGRAWLGFTAASGYFQQAHDLLSWRMRSL